MYKNEMKFKIRNNITKLQKYENSQNMENKLAYPDIDICFKFKLIFFLNLIPKFLKLFSSLCPAQEIRTPSKKIYFYTHPNTPLHTFQHHCPE